MRCLLAVFDPAHRSPDGSYWTWRHPELPPDVLDAFYYGSAAKHFPVGTEPISADGLQCGCASVGDEWICWYRFASGGRDRAGRPGRWVVLAAFLHRRDYYGEDWSWIFDSPPFEHLASQASTHCPLPAPASLEVPWDSRGAAGPASPAAGCSPAGNYATAPASHLTSSVCGAAIRPGRGFDCVLVRGNGIDQISVTVHDGIQQPSIGHRSLDTSDLSSPTAAPPAHATSPEESGHKSTWSPIRAAWRTLVRIRRSFLFGLILGTAL